VRTPKVLRAQAFRIVAVYLACFALSAVALAGFIYWNTQLVLDSQTDDTVAAEATGLVEQYQRLGFTELANVIVRRSVRGEQGLYLLTDSRHRIIAGNLDGWPHFDHIRGGFVEFNYERRLGGAPHLRRARGKIYVLAAGFDLLVARDIHERREMIALFSTILPWSVALMVALGLVGGFLISRNFLARLDAINRTSRRIMAGDFTQRVPVSRNDDEFDELSFNLNRMLDRIERLLHGMREVSDNVAHDLRSPLNRLRSRLELAQRREPVDSEARQAIDGAVEETDNLIATFNALLLIAAAEAGSLRETMVKLDLRNVVEGVGELYAPLADEQGVTLSVDPGAGQSLIEANPDLVSQALANLVDNAIKYTPRGGHVAVGLGQDHGRVALSVADSGPGIPQEDRDRVTERFVRLESSRNSPGTGLGLSLVAAVARLHDAELVFSDNTPGLRATLLFKPAAFAAVKALPQRDAKLPAAE